jgi:type II secretory pathway pseudopilin PulG
MSARKPASRREALTLVEILFALAVLSILLLGVFATLATAQKASIMARERAAASESCFRQLDLVLANPTFDAVADTSGVFEVEYDTGRGGVHLAAAADPYPTELESVRPPASHDKPGTVVTVRDPDGDGSAGVLEVRVTVAWRSVDNTNQRLDAVARRLR